jgi:hypothetical protein
MEPYTYSKEDNEKVLEAFFVNVDVQSASVGKGV